MIPVSVIVATRNEERQIERCLAALQDFSEIIVVDSGSSDRTCELAVKAGARVERFTWNNAYPKKRQWCLDYLSLKHEWIFFVDADEEVTPALTEEIRNLFAAGPGCAGYFVRGRYVLGGKMLRYGLCNNKLVLFDRRKIIFPVVADLDCPGMGEMEGHYQPVLKQEFAAKKLGQLAAPMLHYAYDERWEERHTRYAVWEAEMNRKQAWPRDPLKGRELMKRIFRGMPCRGFAAFMHCYVAKGGFLDGRAGLWFALSRLRYYRMIAA